MSPDLVTAEMAVRVPQIGLEREASPLDRLDASRRRGASPLVRGDDFVAAAGAGDPATSRGPARGTGVAVRADGCVAPCGCDPGTPDHTVVSPLTWALIGDARARGAARSASSSGSATRSRPWMAERIKVIVSSVATASYSGVESSTRVGPTTPASPGASTVTLKISPGSEKETRRARMSTPCMSGASRWRTRAPALAKDTSPQTTRAASKSPPRGVVNRSVAAVASQSWPRGRFG
jgi:hypothetical protein